MSVERAAGRWRAYEKKGPHLDQELMLIGQKIDDLWRKEDQRLHGQPLDFAAYVNVADGSGYLAINSLARAFEWGQGVDDKRDLGRKIIAHQLLHSIVHGIQRAQSEHPDFNLENTDLVQDCLVKVIEWVFTEGNDPKKGWSIPKFINGFSYHEALSPLALKLRVPFHALKNSPARREVGQVPQALCEFGLGVLADPVAVQHLRPGAGFIVDPTEIAERHDLAFQVRTAVNSLPGRHGLMINLRFGLAGGEKMTHQQIADILGVSGGRISEIEKSALRHLRKSERVGE